MSTTALSEVRRGATLGARCQRVEVGDISRKTAFGLEALPGTDELAPPEFVYRQVLDAVLSQRLLPGTRLQEQALADIFSLGRATIRAALQRLAGEGVVDVYSNRGASVSRPDAAEVIDLFDARRVIECELIGRTTVRVRDGVVASKALDALEAHADREREHVAAARRGAALRRACVFHLDLARLAGNEALVLALERQVIRIALAIGLYERALHGFDGPSSRHELIDAIRDGDVRAARRAMRQHLNAMLASLDLDAGDTTGDLGAAFAHLG